VDEVPVVVEHVNAVYLPSTAKLTFDGRSSPRRRSAAASDDTPRSGRNARRARGTPVLEIPGISSGSRSPSLRPVLYAASGGSSDGQARGRVGRRDDSRPGTRRRNGGSHVSALRVPSTISAPRSHRCLRDPSTTRGSLRRGSRIRSALAPGSRDRVHVYRSPDGLRSRKRGAPDLAVV